MDLDHLVVNHNLKKQTGILILSVIHVKQLKLEDKTRDVDLQHNKTGYQLSSVNMKLILSVNTLLE